jgi:hypothetical protein
LKAFVISSTFFEKNQPKIFAKIQNFPFNSKNTVNENRAKIKISFDRRKIGLQ